MSISPSSASAATIFAGAQTINPADASSQIVFQVNSLGATSDIRVKLGDIGLRSVASVGCGAGCPGVAPNLQGVYGSEDLLTLSTQTGFIRFDFEIYGTIGGLASSASPGQVTLQASFILEILNLNNNEGVGGTIGYPQLSQGLLSPGGNVGASGGATHSLVLTTTPTVAAPGGYTPGTFRLAGQIAIPYTNGQALLRLAITPQFLCGIFAPPPGPPGQPAPPATCSYTFDSYNSAHIGGAVVLDENGDPVSGGTVSSNSGFNYSAPLGAVAETPEPATWSLAIAGLGALCFARKRR